MKYALIGCGRIATNHVKAVLNNGLEFVATCDIEVGNIEIVEIGGRLSAGHLSGTDGADYTKSPPPFKGEKAEVIDSPVESYFLQHYGGEL